MLASRELRAGFARIATNVAVVTVSDGRDEHGCTANAWGESLDPPLLLITLRSTSATGRRIVGCGRFAVNLLADTQGWLAKQFARSGPRFDGVAHRSGRLGQPILDGCLASFECFLTETHPFGSYDILVGSVQEVICSEETQPLLFFNGRFCEASAPNAVAPRT